MRLVVVMFGHKPFMPLIYYGPTNHQHVGSKPTLLHLHSTNLGWVHF